MMNRAPCLLLTFSLVLSSCLPPSGDAGFQVMYVNLGGLDNSANNRPSAGIGMAVLVNP
jgi:hypothetical protein